MADGGIGEAALLSEAGADAGAVSGMDLAADAGMGGANAIGGGALSSYGVSPMDLASPESANLPQNLSNIPQGPGTPQGIAPKVAEQAVTAANQASQFNPSTAGLPGSEFMGPPSTISAGTIAGELGQAGTDANPLSGIGSKLMSTWNSMSTAQKVAVGGIAGLAALMKANAFKANFMSPYQPQTAQQVGLGRTLSPQYQPVRPMAEGGITSLAVGGMPGQQYPMSQINYNGYNTPTQMPTSAMQMAGYQPSNTPLSGALEQNMASGGSTGITAAGESTGNGLNIYTPNTSNNSTGAQLAALASQYGVSLPTTMAAEGGIMGLSTGGDPLAEMAAQRQNNAIDPRTGIPYSQEQYGNDSSFLGGLSQGINGLGQSISNGVSSVGRSLGFAEGGSAGNYNLGGYSDGGRLLKGPGDGMSDHIPASIADKQPARLADGEFVVPADVVSHLGNGSTDAGARHLYSMMDKVRKARTGNTKQGKQIQPEKYIPA